MHIVLGIIFIILEVANPTSHQYQSFLKSSVMIQIYKRFEQKINKNQMKI